MHLDFHLWISNWLIFSGESSEPQTPNAEEVPGGENKPFVTDSEPPATTQEDTQKTETIQETKPQQQEEVC